MNLVRNCACPCRQPFTTRHPHQVYAHPTHRPPKPNRGAAHAKAAKALLAALIHGTPCPRCGHPMTYEQRARRQLQAGHTIDFALGGTIPDRVEHAHCNQSAGATDGNLRRGRSVVRTSRPW